ncbi:MAG: biotin--[acetyl-CoA-carboxylase] ligase [Planctomycetes bacterium]|nr:biotin--[acetyl-CoA-carboxylase] ligase [Planctomycetota bacterium]
MQSFHFDTIDSTNEAAKRMIEAGRLNGPAYLLAREQTGGKGRHGRIWLSPRDAGIYLSVVELPGRAVGTQATMFTLAAGVACVEALKETTGVEVKLKPINDLYARGAKLGGILTEVVLELGSVKALIIGVGINVHVTDRPLSVDAPRPICLEQLMPEPRFRKLDHDALVAALVSRIQAWSATAGLGDIDAIKTAWEKHKIPGAAFPEA